MAVPSLAELRTTRTARRRSTGNGATRAAIDLLADGTPATPEA
jgi:hypothetical protein